MASEKTRKLDPTEGSPFEAVIGLEVHVQLLTRAKMFCSCANRFGEEPNSLTCPVCLGQPGSLPVINRKAVEHAIRVGLACGCTVARYTKFDRKNYYYPDLPKNYQISQFDLPVGSGGHVDIEVDGQVRSIGLTRIHLEEDAGKNIHVEQTPESWVDLNRTGVPLLEIVSEPDMRTPQEAGAYLRMLRLIMLYLGVSDCNMEEGSLRCDCNVSIRPRGADHLETRAEIKNLNSFTNTENALAWEIQRQIRLKTSGGEVVQETRLYDPERNETRSMRGKEEAHDYRYFPEPDLAPLRIEEDWIEELRKSLPEMPRARQERYKRELGLPEYHADVLVRDADLSAYFEKCLESHPDARELANWVINAVQEEKNTRGVPATEIGLAPERLVELVQAVDDGKVSRQKARDVFRGLLGNQESVTAVIRSLGLEQISDDSLLKQAVQEVLDANPSAVEDIKQGKKKSVNFIMGQVMRRTKGQGNPLVISKLIEEMTGS